MKILRYIASALSLLALAWAPLGAEEMPADSVAAASGPGFNIQEVIFDHTNDSYEWHITNIGEDRKSVV